MSVVGERLRPTLFERSRPAAAAARSRTRPRTRSTGSRPPRGVRRRPRLPELNEPEVVRHYVNLSQLNYAVDTGFYPLGSCTMKYNPKIDEWAARLPGFAGLHPMAPDAVAQGTLQLLYELEGMLAEVSGMDAVTLQPAAGAHGELTGILMVRAYHRDRGDTERTEVLVPDSSHGTNPATATMAGFRTITIPSAADGGVDVDAFRAALGPRTAAIMITNPSTLGLFEQRIGELLDAIHAAGALAYMDGANLNAILGRFKPGEAGFDVMHINTHKTFSTPHGGGGPGAGPVGRPRRPRAVPALARVLREPDGSFRLEREGERPTSIGRVRSFTGSTGVLVRAYAYLRAHGDAGCARCPTTRCSPRTTCACVCATPTTSRTTARACTSSSPRPPSIRQRTGVRTLDIAKRLIDKGFHPPTIYFPLMVEEAHADRADRDRVARDPGRVRRRADRDRRRGRDASPSSSRPRRTPRPSGGWTRRPPPASRTSAGGA